MEVTAVSAGKGSNVEKLDISTTVLTREEIRSSPQLTLDQMINRQMGVWTSPVPANQVDPTGAVVSMRGFGSTGGEKVLVMVDGMPINDGYFKTIDWSQIPKDTIEKVEIVRGGGGAALWGNLAEGGVINIITREPEKGEARLGLAYGNMNTKVGDASGTLYSGDKVKVGLNLNAIESDGYNTAPPAIAALNSNLVTSKTRTHNGLLSAYFSPTANSKFFVKLNGHELLQDQITYSTANNQWYKVDLRTGGKVNYSDHGSFNFNGFFDYSQMNKSNGQLVNVGQPGGSSINLVTGVGVPGAASISGQLESMNYQSYGASAYIEEQLDLGSWGSLHDIKFGIDARGVDTSDGNNLYAQVGRTDTTANFATFTITGHNAFEGAFAQATYSPKKIPLEVTLGLREDLWQSFDSNINAQFYKNPATTTQAGVNVIPTTAQTFNQIDPRLGLKYYFDNGISLRGALYRNFAAPGMNQLFRTFASSSTATLGNPNVTPESNFGQEIGIDFTGDKVKTQFTIFHNQLTNFINPVTMCGGTAPACTASFLSGYGLPNNFTAITINNNIGNATFEGGEAFVEWKALDVLTLNMSVVKTWAFLDSINSNFAVLNNAAAAKGNPLVMTGTQLPNVPTLMFTTGGVWNLLPNLELGWSVKAWPKYFTSTVVASTGNVNSAAATADVHLSYKFNKKLEFYVNGQNVGNTSYIASNNNGSNTTAPVMGMPRSILGGFKINF